MAARGRTARTLWAFSVAIFCLAGVTGRADANPGFARKYSVGCQMCHIAFPKLNNFGEQFARNGYQFPNEEPAKNSVRLGDERLLLPTSPNFAIRADGFFRVRNDTAINNDIESPWILKLFSYGLLAKDIAYYFYFLASEGGDVVGPEDAFLYFNNIAGGLDWDAVVGQFQVMDSFYAREQRLTFQDLSIYKANVMETVGAGGSFDLTYDRGAFTTFSTGPLYTMVGVTNGNGLRSADANDNFDDNGYKNKMGRVALGLPGATVGVFGYHGKTNPIAPGTVPNRFNRWGPDLTLHLGPRADLRATWLWGRDEHPTFSTTDTPVSHNGGFAEFDVHLNDRWTGVLLYNEVVADELPELQVRTLTANLTYYKMRNLKFMAEYTHDLQPRTSVHPGKTHTGVLGVVLAY
ncbi:MAG TPA: hypothetical protein VFN94_07815 [Nitrospiria bacterium]|nr:hypothetical protein [Nitrospiria bacterium]